MGGVRNLFVRRAISDVAVYPDQSGAIASLQEAVVGLS